ncbi:carbohydrate ABC transporter permease [Paenibacillus flagellatus]|uniref:Sugar ABC transporter ATP-binding protein n=1 Tax=Paenibacillus flagellatus TaxID=2211139 RepID=A0A2V5K2M5_9BACL|nr:carbohydrate ABC transporter permease [Paenibacillus flagellatus]PYI53448.1 sugar ABC transporter ATP-binding protein [Paenibacillus flagellatus]
MKRDPKSRRAIVRLDRTVRYALLAAVSAAMLVPFYWMAATSLKDRTKLFVFPPQWLPAPVHWDNYVEVFARQPFHLYFGNSLYIAAVVTAGTCFFAALAGYAFAKLAFPLRNVLFLLLLSSMMIPTEATAIPLFDWMSRLGLVDTHIPLIVPPMLGAGGMFGVFLLRQFFITVPGELDEAARIDGCTPWTSFWRIMLPLSAPALAALCIFTFLHSWNEFLEPLIYLNTSRLYTLPLALSLFTNESGTEWHLLMAASVMATVPLLAVFFAAQKKFVEGIAMTGLK